MVALTGAAMWRMSSAGMVARVSSFSAQSDFICESCWKSESGLMSGALRHSRIRSMLSCSS